MGSATPAAPRLRLPAFARALMDNRRRGFHPLAVDLVYGDDLALAFRRAAAEKNAFALGGAGTRPYTVAWVREVGAPMLGVKPREYAPGVFCFACVAGVAVTVFDTDGAAAAFDTDDAGAVTWGIFYDLLGELAAYAAEVFVRSTYFDGRLSVADYAASYRVADRWPRWWSDALQQKHEQRRDTLRAAERSDIRDHAGAA